MSFAQQLSERLSSHDDFKTLYARLQEQAAAATLPETLTVTAPPLLPDDVRRLLYCASVFTQTDDEPMKALAQGIALNALLIAHEDVPTRDCLSLLTNLGNFPALTYAEHRHPKAADTLANAVSRAMARTLNAIKVGDEEICLTDFQKQAWEGLSRARALAISAPTSAGKSFLVIEHLCRIALQEDNFLAVYIAPTRALLSEVYATIKKRTEGVTTIRISTVPTIDAEAHPSQIFVLTQERLQALLAISSVAFDMIVVDEAQNLSDGARGMILQECLEQALSRNPGTRVIMLAPGAEGFGEVERAVGLQELEPATSRLPSVIQNRILVSRADEPNALQLTLLLGDGSRELGVLRGQRGFDLPSNRLAAVALELGRFGGSLVYATGPTDAETVALQIFQDSPVRETVDLTTLADFIEKHIHPEYTLATLVRRGVAFHYGKMPTLLREAVEGAFKAGALSYLACTTTLFQGVNLPARNVFIDTPTRGSGARLDPAAMWNFAGRAGRMKSDIVGNVFLVDYKDWPDKPMDDFVAYRIEPSFIKTISEEKAMVLKALDGDMPKPSPRDERPGLVRAAAGLMIARAAKGDVAAFLDRSLSSFSNAERARLSKASDAAYARVDLPATLLATNWTVDPFGLRRLYDDLLAEIAAGDISELIPPNPHDRKRARKAYASIFMRIQRKVNGSTSSFHAVIAGIAVDWMEGRPYPVLLASAIGRETRRKERQIAAWEAEITSNPKSRKRRPKPVNIDDIIRKEFERIEDLVRFVYVQLGKAYVDLLALALKEAGHEARIKEIFNFPLALELGVATQSGWSFMELGLSRIAASALQPHFPNTSLDVQGARNWLASADLAAFQLNPIIMDELQRLGLVHPRTFST